MPRREARRQRPRVPACRQPAFDVYCPFMTMGAAVSHHGHHTGGVTLLSGVIIHGLLGY